MNIVDVSAPDGGGGGVLVPGVERRINVTFTLLLNNNEPDLNNDVAGIDAAATAAGDDDINFVFASYIVDVNLTASDDDDVINQHQLTPDSVQLTGGDPQTSVNGTESEEFTITFLVRN